MSQISNSNKLFSGNVVARNTLYNLLGYGIPLIFAILLIPMLVKGLGEEKFGILNLAWVVIGYFSFLDFGIGKSLTKIIAEKIGLEQYFQIPGFFWTSIIVMFIISLIITILLIIITPVFINNVLKISDNLKPEAINTFYALSLSIPLVTTTAGLRGFLEAYQKFGMINIFRTFLGIFTFAMPVLVLIFTNNLFLIIISLVIIRIIVWVMYFIECLRTNHQIRKEFRISFELMKQVLKLSGWITVSNIVGPLFIYLDRFFIGAIITVAAITYYATPFEVITKLLLIPGALVAVLFPMFSQSYYKNPEYSKTLFKKGVKFIYLFLYPIILLIMTFAYEAMSAWMGLEFADNSSLILQLLSFGVLLNSLAYIPFHYLQGIGKPDIPAKINLLELPFYLLAAWFFIRNYGINGAAFVWMLRIVFDTVILFFITDRIIDELFKSKIKTLFFLTFTSLLLFPFIINDVMFRTVYVFLILLSFIIAGWKYIINKDEKSFLLKILKITNA